jgi:hypothetical protein
MNQVFSHLLVFLMTVTCTLGTGQPHTTGDQSYRTEVEVGCHFGWRGTVNNKKNVPEIMVLFPSQTAYGRIH